jgi:hypothetical protein
MTTEKQYLEGQICFEEVVFENFSKNDFRDRVLEIAQQQGFYTDIPFPGNLNEIPIQVTDADKKEAIGSVVMKEGNRFVDRMKVAKQVLSGEYLLGKVANDQLVFDAISAHEATHLWQITQVSGEVERKDVRHTVVNGGFYDHMIDFLFDLGWSQDDDGFVLAVANDVEVHTDQVGLDWLFGQGGFSDQGNRSLFQQMD